MIRIITYVVLLLGIMYGAYTYVTETQKQRDVFVNRIAYLELTISQNENTITTMRDTYTKLQKENNRLNTAFLEIQKQNNILREKLSDNDIGYLASVKPELVENIINSASSKAGRCFELLSGAEITESEKNAKNAKDFNSECPWLWDFAISSSLR